MSIPNDVADVYEDLKTEITWLHGRWIVYRQLYGTSEKRIEMLNESASGFFYIVQDVLFGEIQVSLSKLTDPAKTGTHDNLSLEQLQARVDATGDVALSQRTRKILDELHNKCQTFRVWRNKRLAHLDLNTMQTKLNPLPGVSRQMVEDALILVREFMNSIEGHYNNGEIGYEHFIMQSDGDALLAIVKEGLRYEELVNDEIVSFDDYRQSKWHDA